MIVTDTDRILGTGITTSVEIPAGTKYATGVLFDGRAEAAIKARIAAVNRKLFGDPSQAQGAVVIDGTGMTVRENTPVRPEVSRAAKERPQIIFGRSPRLTPRLKG